LISPISPCLSRIYVPPPDNFQCPRLSFCFCKNSQLSYQSHFPPLRRLFPFLVLFSLCAGLIRFDLFNGPASFQCRSVVLMDPGLVVSLTACSQALVFPFFLRLRGPFFPSVPQGQGNSLCTCSSSSDSPHQIPRGGSRRPPGLPVFSSAPN